MNANYQTNGALLVGPVVPPGDIATGETLGVIPVNRELFLSMAKRFRVRRHSDGWFVDGRAHRSQIWEYCAGLLGLTVTGSQFIKKCRSESNWLAAKSVGDQEANFFCAWTDENLARLIALIGLQRRKIMPSSTPSDAINAPPSVL